MRRLGTLVWLSVALLVAAGCRQQRPPPLRERIPVAAAESLRAAAVLRPPLTTLQGEGSLRLTVGDRVAPALNLRFSLRDTTALRGSFRPGMLAPVLSIWSSPEGWQLLLPRERAAVVGLAVTDTSRAAHEARLTVRLAWYLLQPQAILGSLQIEEAFRQGADWVFTGSLNGWDPSGRRVSIWVERKSLGIRRWRIAESAETTVASVTYQPPRLPGGLGDGPASRIAFEIRPLRAEGTLRIQEITPAAIPPKPPPAVPAGWEIWEGYRVAEALGLLLEPQAAS